METILYKTCIFILSCVSWLLLVRSIYFYLLMYPRYIISKEMLDIVVNACVVWLLYIVYIAR